jgi:hypothetical protein
VLKSTIFGVLKQCSAVDVLRHFGGSAASIFRVKAQAEQVTSTGHTERTVYERSVSDTDIIGLGRSPEVSSNSNKEMSNCCWHFLLLGLHIDLENGPKRRCISA